MASPPFSPGRAPLVPSSDGAVLPSPRASPLSGVWPIYWTVPSGVLALPRYGDSIADRRLGMVPGRLALVCQPFGFLALTLCAWHTMAHETRPC